MQPKRFFIGILFCALIAQPFAVFSQTPPLLITEIGAFEPSDTEWIEIYNNSGAVLDLTGWKFFENDTNHGLNATSGDMLLEPDEYAIIANKSDVFLAKYPEYSGTLFDSSWSSLKEEGEEIGIKNASGELVEFFTYPASTAATSLERTNESFRNHPTSHSIGIATESTEETQTEVPEENPAEIPEETEAEETSVEIPSEIPEEENEEIIQETSEEAAQEETEEIAQTEENAETSLDQAPVSQEESQSTSLTEALLPEASRETSEHGESQLAPSPAFPPNQPPRAIIKIQSGELVAQEKTTVNFDGSASTDPNNDKLTYFWDMGDSRTETTANPRPHKYDKAGTYTVKLTVTDPSGAKSTVQKVIEVLASEKGKSAAQSKPGSEPGSKSQSESRPKSKTESKSKSSPQSPKIILPEIPMSSLSLKGYFIFVPYDQKIDLAKIALAKDTNKAKSSKTKKRIYANGDKSTSVKITEILPNPGKDDSAGEWVEIFNSGKAAINLGNWGLADNAKKSSPYLIPDDMEIMPGEYMIFPKSETGIALNNDADGIFLSDYENNVIDSVSYEESKTAQSYALINIVGAPALVASTEPVASRRETWEWTSDVTPAAANPTFEIIKGVVAELLEDETYIALGNGETKKISFNEEVLDPLMAHAVMPKGSRVLLQAKKQNGDSYKLIKIEEIQPIAAQSKEKSGKLFWIIVGIVALGIALGSPLIILRIKKFLNAKSEREALAEEIPTEEISAEEIPAV